MTGKLLRVVDVDAYFTPPPHIVPILQCTLEDGRVFNLYSVPGEVVFAINRIKGVNIENNRETIFEILPLFNSDLKDLGKRIDKVIIDEIDETTQLYTAKIYIKGDGFVISKKMVPSHAVFLAYLIDIPIYVSEELVIKQIELEAENEDSEQEA